MLGTDETSCRTGLERRLNQLNSPTTHLHYAREEHARLSAHCLECARCDMHREVRAGLHSFTRTPVRPAWRIARSA